MTHLTANQEFEITVTEQEIAMVETLRGMSQHREIQFTASLDENGVWECVLKFTPHPNHVEFMLEYNHVKIPPNAVYVDRGVGTSFVDAFNNLGGNDTEPFEDAAWAP